MPTPVSAADAAIINSFSKVNPIVYIREPPPPATLLPEKNEIDGAILSKSKISNPPKTVIIFAWMDATMKNIAKYVAGHKQLFPQARIVLVTTSMFDFLYRFNSSQIERMKAIVEIINEDPKHSVLVHAFSNGGAQSVSQLAMAYRKATGRSLPLKALVLDSSPGRTTFWEVTTLFIQMLPKAWLFRIPLKMLVYICIGFWWLLLKVSPWKDQVDKARANLNSKELFSAAAKRLYLYSKTDVLIRWQDVERHSFDAQQKGFKCSMEKYEKSEHVAHTRADSARYWKAIERLWSSVILDIV